MSQVSTLSWEGNGIPQGSARARKPKRSVVHSPCRLHLSSAQHAFQRLLTLSSGTRPAKVPFNVGEVLQWCRCDSVRVAACLATSLPFSVDRNPDPKNVCGVTPRFVVDSADVSCRRPLHSTFFVPHKASSLPRPLHC